MTRWKSPAEETKSKTAPSPVTPSQIKSHRRGIAPGSFIKPRALRWARSGQHPSSCAPVSCERTAELAETLAATGFALLVGCAPLLRRGAGRLAEVGESCRTCWGSLVLIPRFSWEVLSGEETSSSTEGSNAASGEGNPSLRAVPPMSITRSFLDRRRTCNSTGN